MKRFFLIAAMFILAVPFANAQMQQLPNDPAVRQGKLDNGLTYYIRHNDKPEQRAEFYLATNVGAIQEAPDQDGLAHFLEHMCFNGTKNFPGKGILNWLESIGASFGGNVNASTGVEETQYMLNNIPLVRETVVDTCLLILHDYSHFVLNEPEEIDKERGVIIEERRARRNASWRLHEQSLPYYYGDTKYGDCTLIGQLESLQNFKPESLVNFYQTWYRPDMQAVIVVGDVDVDSVEQKIKTIFADIPAPVDPKQKDYIKIPDNEEPIIGVLTDPEVSNTTVELLWKSEARPEEVNSTAHGMLLDLITDMVSQIMTERFNEIVSKPGAPFFAADLGVGNICESCEVVVGDIAVKDGEAITGLRAFLTEVEKMKRFGFTEDEVSRAKTEIESRYETRANRADTRKNAEFVPDLISNFFDNYSYMEPATEYQVAQMLLSQLNADVLNMVVAQMITPENLVVVYKGPEKEGLVHPTEAEILSVVKEVENAEIEAPAAEEIATEFLNPATLKGSKVKKSKSSVYGATEWTLKNGVKVVLFPTDYEKDRISFNLYKMGGTSLIETEDLPSFESNIFQMFTEYNGVSDFTASTVNKMLAGKQLSVYTNITSLNTGLNGSSTRKDLETALQLLYLNYTDPRFDKDAFDQAEQTIRAILPNLVNQPNYKLQKELYGTAFDNNPRNILISEEVLDKANIETLERVTRGLFKDAAGSTFIMVGDFVVDEVKPLVEKYVGSLPKGKKAPKWIDRNEDVTRKNVVNDFSVDMQTPMTTAAQLYRMDDTYSVENSVVYSALEYILNMLYVETLREDEGGTYGASVSASLTREPKQYGMLQIAFQTNPDSADKLRELAKDGLRGIAANGPTAEQYDKTYKNLEKNIPERRITNSYWMSAIKNWYDHSEDIDKDYEAALKALTPEKIKNLAARFLSDGNLIEIVMRPGKTGEAE
ncbi:MAG: insulinase family protein [Bacteroidales bacterium]|nr:insulinase family protein [Bacteroidales bacterium]